MSYEEDLEKYREETYEEESRYGYHNPNRLPPEPPRFNGFMCD